jgi:hypothetical protein
MQTISLGWSIKNKSLVPRGLIIIIPVFHSPASLDWPGHVSASDFQLFAMRLPDILHARSEPAAGHLTPFWADGKVGVIPELENNEENKGRHWK